MNTTDGWHDVPTLGANYCPEADTADSRTRPCPARSIRASDRGVTPRLSLVLLLALAACRDPAPHGPIAASVIGAPIDRATLDADPDGGPLGEPAAVLALATRQGLVRFDGGGQVVPGLAARWIVSDSGRSLIFRLPDGATSAPEIARRLRAAIALTSCNPLKPLLGAVASIEAVTPQVVDVELSAPRPNLLPLFAQAALAVGRRPGGGPLDVVRLTGGVATPRTRPAPPGDADEAPPPPTQVTIRGERAGLAVARFAAGRVSLVLGGRFADLAVARAAQLPAEQLRFDPAPGLFGLAFSAAVAGFAATADNRRALAMAIDRERIATVLDIPGWQTATAIVPTGTAEIAHPLREAWASAPIGDRRAVAARTVAAWRAGGGEIAPLRIAMPAGPGARLLFALVAADWRSIGIPAIAVAADAPADLTLIDEVAPADTAAFYLRRFACDRGVPCTAAGDRMLIAARVTPSLEERGVLLMQSSALIETHVPFIALGSPVRWSLVARDLDLWRDSPRAIHPLDQLRSIR